MAFGVEHIMGMPIGIDVRDAGADTDLIERAHGWFRHVDAVFSTYRADSDISRINRGELDLADADPDVGPVLERCAELRDETRGYFDATALVAGSGGVDPTGLVKGWAVDRAADLLLAAGMGDWSINAGGDVRVHGRPAPGERWRIGIQHPLQPDALAAVLESAALAVATSGTYERGEHIVDPVDGGAPRGVLSVSIAGPDLGTADAYATAAFAMGVDGAQWTTTLAGYGAMTILADETVLVTPGFDRHRVS
jgi:thiamine biosynthesis lipoprotein